MLEVEKRPTWHPRCPIPYPSLAGMRREYIPSLQYPRGAKLIKAAKGGHLWEGFHTRLRPGSVPVEGVENGPNCDSQTGCRASIFFRVPSCTDVWQAAMPLNTTHYLTKQGWKGHGTPLDGEKGRGLKKPLIIPQKRNLGGVGQNRDRAVEWWDDIFAVGIALRSLDRPAPRP